MGEALTSRAKQFAAINRVWGIVSGQWLDAKRRPVTGDPATWVKLRYRFANNQQITLGKGDLASLEAAGVKPVWYGDKVA